jgi:FKBP-type peptidyl-prolyl cis-trans isomerase SlyD
MQIKKNTVVSINYELFDSEGNLVEKTNKEPFIYLHGGYNGIFPLVEETLENKEAGEVCRIKLEPNEAFGPYDKELVRVEPRYLFPQNVAVGMQFEGATEDGKDHRVFRVTQVIDDKIVVDGNHPLAGKTLDFSCTIKEVRAATDEEISHGHVHHGRGHHHH